MINVEDVLLEAFAKTLRKQRIAAGLSQEELAHRAGVSMRYVSLLESRRHQPSLATIYGLCFGLGLSMADLIANVEAEFDERRLSWMHFEVHQPGNRNALGSHQRRGSNNTPYERSLPSKDGPEQTFALGTVPQCGCTEAAVRFLMQHFHRLNGS